MKRKEIVLVKETRQGLFVKKVMDAISPYLAIKPDDKVAIKIDLSGSREIYSNTHYETVDGLIRYLKEEFGVSRISVIEGSDGAYYSGKSTWDIFYKFKYKEVELHGAELVNLDEQLHDQTFEVETISGPKEIHYTRFEADYVITVVPPKTHNIFPVALSIPNIIGYVKPEDRSLVYGASSAEMKKINYSTNDKFLQMIVLGGKNFAKLLKELKPNLVLIDGLYGMEGKGPVKGSPVFHGFSVASEDVVLVDALTTYLMGFEVDDIPYITYAYREGLGNNRWQNVIGVDPPQVKFPYRPHPLFPRQRMWRETGNNKKSEGNQGRGRFDKRDRDRNRNGDNRNRNGDNRDRFDRRDRDRNREGDNRDRNGDNRNRFKDKRNRHKDERFNR